MPGEDPAPVVSSMLESLPQVNIKEQANHTSFLVGEKVFAYTKDDAVAIKLPREKVEQLVDEHYASALVMGKRRMKE